jgi:uncharacterized membrane protein
MKNQIHQIEINDKSAFYSEAIKYLSAQKVAKILGLPHDQAFSFSDEAHAHDMHELKEQNELKDIEARLAQKMINELQYEKPVLVQKIIGKKTSVQLPIQGIELAQTHRPSRFLKVLFALFVMSIILGFCYWALQLLQSIF